MSNILKNSEIKKVIIAVVTLGIIFYCISFLSINLTFNNISKNYAKENIALAGAILEKYPELEDEIIPIIIKGYNKENYNLGLSYMDKYSYGITLPVYKNYLINSEKIIINKIWIIVWTTFLLLLILVNIKIIMPIFNKLKVLGNLADNMVEGKFNSEIIDFKEGELFIFYNKFLSMGERLKKALNDLQNEKILLKDIISDISHQLKTPLVALISYNDILKNHESMSVEDKNMFIEFTSKQLDRMEWLITTLLKYARIESNVVKYNKDTIPLKETIVNAIGPLRLKAEEKSQKIILNCHSQGYYLHDKKWMEEAISNIIKNAIEHTENNGIIDIKLEETPLSIGISIKDNGEGIRKDEIRKIFNRFYKGENSLNPTSIGIGLSLSRKIIEAHNGTITVESQLNKGTTFYITFLKGII